MSDIAVVIPALEPSPETLDSVPAGVETAVVTEGGRAEARNIGAERTDGDVLVFCDSDIAFDAEWFWRQVEQTPPGVVSGLVDYDFGLLLTRFMVVHRADFERVGGFDSRLQHMEDTEFCLRCQRAGIGLRRLARDAVAHEDHPNDVTPWLRVRTLAHVLRRHRWAVAPHLPAMVGDGGDGADLGVERTAGQPPTHADADMEVHE